MPGNMYVSHIMCNFVMAISIWHFCLLQEAKGRKVLLCNSVLLIQMLLQFFNLIFICIVLDFVDFTNGRYCAGVVAFVSITVKSFDIHRENIGYATSTANTKGFAIYKSRKV